VQSDRVPARIQSRVVQSVIRLRLWTARILPEEAVHQIKDDLLRDELVGINFGETFRAKPRALRKPAPVINVSDGHVVNATSDNIDNWRRFAQGSRFGAESLAEIYAN